MAQLSKMLSTVGRSQIERAASLYRDISLIEIVKSGRWVGKNAETASICTEFQDIDNNTKVRKEYRVDFLTSSEVFPKGPGCFIDSKVTQTVSPSNKFSVSFNKVGELYRVDISDFNGIFCSIRDVVAQPISDPNLQYFSWMEDESGFVFVGEKPKKKLGNPWDLKNNSSQEEIESFSVNSKWETKDSWGECFTDNSCFTIYFVDIQSKVVIDLIDDEFSLLYSCVSPIILNDDTSCVLFTAVDHCPRKLGIVYCRNRPSRTYTVKISQPKQKPLSLKSVSELRGMFNTRVHNGTIAFFSQARVGSPTVIDNFPHNCASSLHVTSVKKLLDPRTDPSLFFDDSVIIPIISLTPEDKDTGFHGLYPSTGNDLWWIGNGSFLLVGSVSRSSMKVFCVDICQKTISAIDCCNSTPTGQWSILDVANDVALLHFSSLLTGSKVVAVDFTTKVSSSVFFGRSFPFQDFTNFYKVEVVRVEDAHDSEAIYTYRIGEETRPTLVVVHGGPHSTDTNGFVHALMLYLLEGWNIFSINYGGSLGFGYHRIQELMGSVGSNDVFDCQKCIKSMETRWDPKKLVVYGGSHGGFLAGHLTSRFPDLFRAAIIRNPVINLASSHFETDIPDWNLAVCGARDSNLDVEAMYKMSPIIYAHNVKASTLLGIGLDDNRVRPDQGRSWYHALKAAPTKPLVRMIEYPGNGHALDGVHASADFAIRGVVFANDSL